MTHTHNQMTVAVMAILCMATSCMEEIGTQNAGVTEGHVIEAEIDQPLETRVCIDPITSATSGTISFYWMPEDEIGVFTDAGENNIPYCNTETEENVKKVTFAPSVNVSGTPTYAYYPYSADSGTDISAIRATVPSEQTINENLDNIPGMYRYGYYKSTSDGASSFGFKHVLSTIRWYVDAAGTELDGCKLKSIQIAVKRGTKEVPICGDFTFDAETGTYIAGENTSNTVTINFEGEPTFDSSITFYTSLFPTIKRNDVLYFTINTIGYTATYKLSSNVILKKNNAYTYSMKFRYYSTLSIVENDITDEPEIPVEPEEPVEPETPVEPEEPEEPTEPETPSEPEVTITAGTFKCATYNIKSGTDGTIGTMITNDGWDFFNFCECFSGYTKNLDTYTFGSKSSTLGDGLYFATRNATCSLSGEYIDEFDSEYGGIFDGANTAVAKGFRYYLVTFADGVQVDVYMTHMNTYSSSGTGHINAQHAQLKEVATWIANHRNGRPVIFMGDTNCRYTRHDFETYFWSIIRAEGITYNDPWVDFQWNGVYPTYPSKSLMVSDATGTNSETDIICADTQQGEVVDKIIYINDVNADTQITALSYLRDMDYSGLSDHMPIVVEFKYEKTSTNN